MLAVSAYATEAHPLHVCVDITADDSLVESGLLKRLRALKDVEITTHIEDAERGLYTVAIATHDAHHDVVGYAISVLYVEGFPLYSEFIKRGPEDSRPVPENKWLRDFLDKDRKGRAVLLTHRIYACSPEGLDHALDKISADFDVTMLEPIRKSWADTDQWLKDRGLSKP